MWHRAANTSCSLWSRTLASIADRAKTVIGSDKRPTQSTARRLRYGVARTDTPDCSASRGRHRCRDRWIRRISHCADEQATHTPPLPSGLCLWIDGGRGTARKASQPARVASARWPRRGSRDWPVRAGGRGCQHDRCGGRGGAGNVLLSLPDQGARGGRGGAGRRGQDRGPAPHETAGTNRVCCRCSRCWSARCWPPSGGWVRCFFRDMLGLHFSSTRPVEDELSEHPLAEFVIAAIAEAQARGTSGSRMPTRVNSGCSFSPGYSHCWLPIRARPGHGRLLWIGM